MSLPFASALRAALIDTLPVTLPIAVAGAFSGLSFLTTRRRRAARQDQAVENVLTITRAVLNLPETTAVTQRDIAVAMARIEAARNPQRPDDATQRELRRTRDALELTNQLLVANNRELRRVQQQQPAPTPSAPASAELAGPGGITPEAGRQIFEKAFEPFLADIEKLLRPTTADRPATAASAAS